MNLIAAGANAGKIDLRRHQDKLIHSAVAKVNFAQPAQHIKVVQPSLFADLTASRLHCSLPFLDVPFGDRPAILGVLNQEDFKFVVAIVAEYNAASRRFTNNFLNRRLATAKIFFKPIEVSVKV